MSLGEVLLASTHAGPAASYCARFLFKASGCAKRKLGIGRAGVEWLNLERVSEAHKIEDVLQGLFIRAAFKECKVSLAGDVDGFIEKVTQRAQSMYYKQAVVVLGSAGSGKSSLVNSLLGKEVAATGNAEGGVTVDAQVYKMQHESNEILLVDTEGWTHDWKLTEGGLCSCFQRSKFDMIEQAYRAALREMGCHRSHNPYIVLFVMMGPGGMRNQKFESASMQQAFKRFNSGRVAIRVIPVVTWAESISDRTQFNSIWALGQERAKLAFQRPRCCKRHRGEFNARILPTRMVNATAYTFDATAPPVSKYGLELDDAKTINAEIHEAVVAQQTSSTFQREVRIALAESLSENCEAFCKQNPFDDNPWALFKAAHKAIANAEGKALSYELDASEWESPPWQVLRQIPNIDVDGKGCFGKTRVAARAACLPVLPGLLKILGVLLFLNTPLFFAFTRVRSAYDDYMLLFHTVNNVKGELQHETTASTQSIQNIMMNISSLEQSVSNINGKLQHETAASTQSIQNLMMNISSLEQSVNDINGKLQHETAARMQSIEDLIMNASNLEQSMNNIKGMLQRETTARLQSIKNLGQLVNVTIYINTKMVFFNGQCYGTLDGHSKDDRNFGTQCQTPSCGIPVPSGWELSPPDPDIVSNVIARYAWGTPELLCSDGNAYWTAIGDHPGKEGKIKDLGSISSCVSPPCYYPVGGWPKRILIRTIRGCELVISAS